MREGCTCPAQQHHKPTGSACGLGARTSTLLQHAGLKLLHQLTEAATAAAAAAVAAGLRGAQKLELLGCGQQVSDGGLALAAAKKLHANQSKRRRRSTATSPCRQASTASACSPTLMRVERVHIIRLVAKAVDHLQRGNAGESGEARG